MLSPRYQEALRTIRVGCLYQSVVTHMPDGYRIPDVRVVSTDDFGYVQWEKSAGPGLGDRYREADVFNFLESYRLKDPQA